MSYYTDIFCPSHGDITLLESAVYMDQLDLEIDKSMSAMESVFMMESEEESDERQIKQEGIFKKVKEALLSLIKKVQDTINSLFKKREKFDVDEFINTNKDVRAKFSMDYEKFAKVLDEEYYKTHKIAKMINKLTGKDAQAIKDAEINLSYIGADAVDFIENNGGTVAKIGITYAASKSIIKNNEKLNKINTEIGDYVRKTNNPEEISKMNLFKKLINKNADLINKAHRIGVKMENEIKLGLKTYQRIDKYEDKDGLGKKATRGAFHTTSKLIK